MAHRGLGEIAGTVVGVTDLAPSDTTTVDPTGATALRGIGPTESVAVAIRRMYLELLDGAIADLRGETPPTPGGQPQHELLDEDMRIDAGVHGARKKMKRLRSLLRLVRDDLGSVMYRRENAVLRDTARTVGPLRDARVMVDTVRRLRAEEPTSSGDAGSFGATEAWLLGDLDRIRTRALDGTLTDAADALVDMRARWDGYRLEDMIRNDFDAIEPGIGRVYRRGRASYEDTMRSPTTEHLHAWRKLVKYLRHQMETLAPIQPRLIGAIASELEDLGESLGVDHDLAVLADLVSTESEVCPDEGERTHLLASIAEQRTGLEDEAIRTGGALYHESTDQYVDRMGSYWRAGRR